MKGKIFSEARRLKSYGEGDDTILAHINPEEAELLSKRFGYDINPVTGLPQFGWFRKVMQTKVMKKILPILGGGVGFLVGGPAGSAIGAGVGHAIPRRGNVLENFIQGAAVGGAAGLGLQGAGTMLGSPTLMGGTGIGSIPGFSGSMGGLGGGISPILQMLAPGMIPGASPGGMGGMGGMGMGGMGGAPQAGPQSSMGGGAGSSFNFLQSLGGGRSQGGHGNSDQGIFGSLVNGLGGPLNTLLAGTTLAGMLGGKSKISKKQKEEHEREKEEIKRQTGYGAWGAEYQPYKVRPLNRRYKEPTAESPTFYDEVNPATQYYAQGGHVGYIDGEDGGQDDNVKVKLPPKAYVMDATTVSLFGDGNSRKGAKYIKKEIVDTCIHSGIVRNPQNSQRVRLIDAKVSPGEYIIEPEVVDAWGGGNNEKGSKVFDKMRNNLRTQKGVKKFLPPKSKPVHSYMR